jgi:hypothetical protein
MADGRKGAGSALFLASAAREHHADGTGSSLHAGSIFPPARSWQAFWSNPDPGGARTLLCGD